MGCGDYHREMQVTLGGESDRLSAASIALRHVVIRGGHVAG